MVDGVAGVAQLALVGLLGRADVLVHERHQALLELGTALAWLEVHRSPSKTWCQWVYRPRGLRDRRSTGERYRLAADGVRKGRPATSTDQGAPRSGAYVAFRRSAPAPRLWRLLGAERVGRYERSAERRDEPRPAAGPGPGDVAVPPAGSSEYRGRADRSPRVESPALHAARTCYAAHGGDVQQLLRDRLSVLSLARLDPHGTVSARHACVRQQPARRRVHGVPRTPRGTPDVRHGAPQAWIH